MSGRRRLRLALVAAPLALVLLLVVQAAVARRRDYPFEAFERIAHRAGPEDGPALRVAMLGDSTVAGVGALYVDGTLPVQTAERLTGLLDRPVEVTGVGVSGARTAHILTGQSADLDAYDVIVVVVGSNDVTHGTPPWRLRADTRALLDGLPDPVVLGGVPLFGGTRAIPRPLRDVVRWYAGVLRRVQADVATEADHVTFVDIAAEASPRFRGVPDAMSSDGFHPAPVGYGFWADALADGVVAALSPRRVEDGRHM